MKLLFILFFLISAALALPQFGGGNFRGGYGRGQGSRPHGGGHYPQGGRGGHHNHHKGGHYPHGHGHHGHH
ncbi:hypothetical protein ACLKA7_002633 [Drosophila subpalustris]